MTTYCVLGSKDSDMNKLWSFRSSWARTWVLKYLMAIAMMNITFKAMGGPSPQPSRSGTLPRREDVFFLIDDLGANLPQGPLPPPDLVSPSSEHCRSPLWCFSLLGVLLTLLLVSLLEQTIKVMVYVHFDFLEEIISTSFLMTQVIVKYSLSTG